MAQQVVAAERIEEIDEQDAITRILQLYIDGSARGDVAKLKEAFHPDSRMFGSLAGRRIDIPIQAFFELAAKGPADTTGRYRARVLNVTRAGDAAVAQVAEDGFWGSVSFVDFFSLAKIDGRWWIVNKTFAHTGGEPPAF
jgi:Putative lumazine-binding